MTIWRRVSKNSRALPAIGIWESESGNLGTDGAFPIFLLAEMVNVPSVPDLSRFVPDLFVPIYSDSFYRHRTYRRRGLESPRQAGRSVAALGPSPRGTGALLSGHLTAARGACQKCRERTRAMSRFQVATVEGSGKQVTIDFEGLAVIEGAPENGRYTFQLLSGERISGNVEDGRLINAAAA